MALIVGEPAPDFSLYDNEKKKVCLADLKGNSVLLLFFPFAFTSVCTAELCSVRDNLALYNNLNARVFGISVDSIYSLNKYKQEQNLNFPLLSDFNKEVSKKYNSLYQTFSFNMNGVSKRAAFIIDKNGILRYMEILEDAEKQPDFNAINKILTEIAVTY